VLIGAGATVLGNITVGKGAQVAAGSLVLKDVPPKTMVAGSPARPLGKVSGAYSFCRPLPSRAAVFNTWLSKLPCALPMLGHHFSIYVTLRHGPLMRKALATLLQPSS